MMDLLKPPTDNLYKFQAVGGIALTLAGFIFPILFFLQTGMEYLGQLRGRDEFKVHEEFTKQRRQTLELRKQQAADEKNKLLKRLNQLTSAPQEGHNSGEIDKLDTRIRDTDRQLELLADALHEANLNLALKEAQIKNEETVSFNRRRNSRYFMVIGIVIAGIGLFYTYIGFRRWGKRLQLFQDIIVQKEAEAKLKAKTEIINQVEQGTPCDNPTQVQVSESTE
jgi:hypothetical protein